MIDRQWIGRTLRNTVIIIMVNVRKMNDFVNQASQCNQLGKPIIFIDSWMDSTQYSFIRIH